MVNRREKLGALHTRISSIETTAESLSPCHEHLPRNPGNFAIESSVPLYKSWVNPSGRLKER